MADRCKQEEPKVIDNAMIERCITEQGPTGEAGRLVQEEGIPLDEVEQIRLEFSRILRIDHLWMLTALTKLSLSNNLIERIENLDALTNLKELDLSFNKISKIENLDALVKIEILTLFENEITKLENMDTLKKLIIFSIGKNLITDKKNVIYLRRFPNLQSLNMAGNPCSEDGDFLTFIAAFLPQITYYQYRIVPKYERETGIELYTQLLRQVVTEEATEKVKQDKIEAELAEAELHSESFVEFLGSRHLFDQMFHGDEEGLAFLTLNNEVKAFHQEYEESFVAITKQIFNMGQVQFKIRRLEVDQFFETVNTAKKKAQQQSIVLIYKFFGLPIALSYLGSVIRVNFNKDKMEEFLVQKAACFQNVKKLEEQLNTNKVSIEEVNTTMQQYSDEYNDLIHKIWKDLMGLELTLYEQMEDVVQKFELSLTEMINVFIEGAQGYFAELRTLEQTYMENVSAEANAFQTLTNVQEDIYIPEELVQIMADKDILLNALGATHDLHMLTIDTREDTLVSRARAWLNNLVGNLSRNEIERNRGKVLEINHFLDIQREEFDDLHAATVGSTMDPDVSAAFS